MPKLIIRLQFQSFGSWLCLLATGRYLSGWLDQLFTMAWRPIVTLRLSIPSLSIHIAVKLYSSWLISSQGSLLARVER